MNAIVVDASVAIKWFIPEVHAIAATRWLDKSLTLYAPDLIFAEVGNILWKKQRSQELTFDLATEILNNFKNLPLVLHANENLLLTAWEIANQYQRTVYDSLYLALAQTQGCPVVTADKALYNAMQNTPLASFLVWVEA